MAKVYDALKRVEREREQLAAAAVAAVRRSPASLQRSVWKRWFGGRPEPPSAPVSPPPDTVLAEQLEAVISRFDALEEHATRTIPSAEHLIQLMQTRLESFETDLTRLDAKVGALEHALAAQTASVADRLNERVARLNTRVSVLLAVVVVTLLAVLFRL